MARKRSRQRVRLQIQGSRIRAPARPHNFRGDLSWNNSLLSGNARSRGLIFKWMIVLENPIRHHLHRRGQIYKGFISKKGLLVLFHISKNKTNGPMFELRVIQQHITLCFNDILRGWLLKFAQKTRLTCFYWGSKSWTFKIFIQGLATYKKVCHRYIGANWCLFIVLMHF